MDQGNRRHKLQLSFPYLFVPFQAVFRMNDMKNSYAFVSKLVLHDFVLHHNVKETEKYLAFYWCFNNYLFLKKMFTANEHGLDSGFPIGSPIGSIYVKS